MMNNLLLKLLPLLTPQRLRYPYFIGGALWLSWIISLSLGAGNTDMDGHLIGADYVAFYTAGKILQMDRSPDLYNLELAHQVQQPLYPAPSDNFHPYLNPPFYAWLFIPFTSIPYPWSPLLWMIFNLCVLWAGLRLLIPENTWKIFLLALTWRPAFAAIGFGQNAFLSLGILILAYVLIRHERKFAAGLAAGLLLYKPQLLIGLGLYWLLDLRRNWHIFAGMAATGALLAGGSLWLMPEATREYIFYAQKIAANLMTVPSFPIWNAHSVQAFWLGLFPGWVNFAVGLHLICALAGIWFFLRHREIFLNNRTLGYGAAVCLTVWITPYIMIYDWVLLLIPAILFWQELPRWRNQLQVVYAILWVVAFFSVLLTLAQWTLFGHALQISIPIFMMSLIVVSRLIRRSTGGLATEQK
jgi:alpha-1,2-mannosyltransferase